MLLKVCVDNVRGRGTDDDFCEDDGGIDDNALYYYEI
jgi:hypothetical protein